MINPESWNVSPSEAIAIQRKLQNKVRLEDDFGDIKTIAGVDISIGIGWAEGKCGIVVLSFEDLRVLEVCTHSAPVSFPYIPGLLAFREIPIFLETYQLLKIKPDMLFFDGHGYAHPRRFGIACHGGVLLDKPSIGCAKSKLIGYYTEPGNEAGSVSPLIANDGERIGDVLRTKTAVKPVFISPGHRVSFDTATQLALKCTHGLRIPEPTRLAHESVSGKGVSVSHESEP